MENIVRIIWNIEDNSFQRLSYTHLLIHQILKLFAEAYDRNLTSVAKLPYAIVFFFRSIAVYVIHHERGAVDLIIDKLTVRWPGIILDTWLSLRCFSSFPENQIRTDSSWKKQNQRNSIYLFSIESYQRIH